MVIEDVKRVLAQTLLIGDKVDRFDASTALFGSIPEFDSMAVATVVAGLEEKFGITINDEDIRAEVFETVGSLSRLVEHKLSE